MRPQLVVRRIDCVSEVVPRDELQAAIEARRELGSEMEPAVIDAFVERIDQRLAERAEEREKSLRRKRDHQKEMVLGAMGISIPCSRLLRFSLVLPVFSSSVRPWQ